MLKSTVPALQFKITYKAVSSGEKSQPITGEQLHYNETEIYKLKIVSNKDFFFWNMVSTQF